MKRLKNQPAQSGQPARAPSHRKSASVEDQTAPSQQATGSPSDASAPAPTKREAKTEDILPIRERLKLRKELLEREQIIRHKRKNWQAGATALMEIRDLRLYRALGFTDFGKYCTESLRVGKSTVNRQIAIGEVFRILASTEAKFLPASERQLRPLLGLRKPKQASEVWGKKVSEVWAKAVKDSEITCKDITEKSVLVARKQLGFDPTPNEKPPEADLEQRWVKLEALLEHEREFWPVERRRDLRVRIVSVIGGWKDVKDCRSELQETTELKPIDIAAGKILSVEFDGSIQPANDRKLNPDSPTIAEVLTEVVDHFRGISEECESQRANLPENLQGSSKEDELSEMADATQRASEDLEDIISTLDEAEGDDDEGSNRNQISAMCIKPPRFIGGSRPKRIGRLVEIIETVAEAVKPRSADLDEKLSEVASDLQNF